jgi:hypothetical protein
MLYSLRPSQSEPQKKKNEHIMAEDEGTLEHSVVIDRLFETWHSLRFVVIPAAGMKITLL